jgi:reactive intermediate/imine deaminase
MLDDSMTRRLDESMSRTIGRSMMSRTIGRSSSRTARPKAQTAALGAQITTFDASRRLAATIRRMAHRRIHTDAAPKAIGSYSQAIRTGETVYLSGQVPLDPASMKLVDGPIERQIERVFENLKAVAEAAGGSLADIAKLNVYLTDLSDFPHVNEVMRRFFNEPFPARATIGVAALPLGAPVEIDAVLVLDSTQE